MTAFRGDRISRREVEKFSSCFVSSWVKSSFGEFFSFWVYANDQLILEDHAVVSAIVGATARAIDFALKLTVRQYGYAVSCVKFCLECLHLLSPQLTIFEGR